MTSAGPRTRNEILWLAGIMAVVIALRVIALGGDPMPDLDPGFISDSGTWWKNARLHAGWGVWMIDDGNYGILTGPAYTLALRGVFGLFGVGYAQGNAVSAASGIVSVVLIYLMVRRQAGAAPALLAAAFTGINVLTIAYDRAAYPESFQQMMMVAAVAAILASPGRAWLAALGGVAAAIVLLAKPPGLVLAPVATATWAALWLARGTTGQERSAIVKGFLAYSAGALLVLGIVAALFFRQYAQDVWLHFSTAVADQQVLSAGADSRVPLFFSRIGYRLNGFFRHEWYLLVMAAALGAARIARVIRTPVTTVEIAAWIWLVMGFGAMGLQTYQQDRRFLFLIPPLAILSALALARATLLGESAWASARARRIGIGAGAGVLAVVLLFYAVPLGAWKMIAVGRMLGRDWSYGFAGGAMLSLGALGVALLAAWRLPNLRWRGNPRLQIAVAMLPVAFVLARSGPQVLRRGEGLQGVSRMLDRISADWPAQERYAAGWSSGTVSLGSRVIPVNHELKGPRAAERFRPRLEIYAVRSGQPLRRAPIWEVPGRPTKVDCVTLPVWPDAGGTPRLEIHIFVDPERLTACQAAAHDSASGSR